MSESLSPKPESATPQTSFALTKTVQVLGTEMLAHADRSFLEDLEYRGEKFCLIDRGEKYLGELIDWEGRFFSFANKNIPPMDPENKGEDNLDALVQIDFKPYPRPTKLPEGTFMTLQFDCLPRFVKEGEAFQRTIAFRQEGGPMVEDRVLDHITPKEGHTWLRVDHYRKLTELEAQNLLCDVADLKLRFDEYLVTHTKLLWAD